MSSPYKGVYYIEGRVLFPTQIIVTRELDRGAHIWLKALSEKLGKEDTRNLLDGIRRLTEKIDREFADSVLEVSIGVSQIPHSVGYLTLAAVAKYTRGRVCLARCSRE